MQRVRVKGVLIQGKRMSGAEMFAEEYQQDTTPSTRKVPGSKHPTVRDPYPAWVISDTFSQQWPFSFTITQVRKWWRLGIISEELCLLRCTSCLKSVVIMREHNKGTIFCPYCKEAAQPVADQEAYLTALCKYILSRDGREYMEERS